MALITLITRPVRTRQPLGGTMIYRIKLISWDKSPSVYTGCTPFGSYYIRKTSNGWLIEYCFVEYFDEGALGYHPTLKAAKSFAQENWRGRLLPALTLDISQPAKAWRER
jgi:hypothetical protein